MKYATTQRFGGERAHVGKMAVCKVAFGTIRACMVCHVFDDGEFELVFVDCPMSTYDGVERMNGPYIPRLGERGLKPSTRFHTTRSEEDIDNMPVGTWTWPVRV